MAKICLRAVVSGHVQGVFFRRETRRVCLSKGLTGWVKNLKDGRVEAMVCGEEKDVQSVEAWLWQGPTAARVDTVVSDKISWQLFSDFKVVD